MELPKRTLMETLGTPSFFSYDHYESTHNECDRSHSRARAVQKLVSGDWTRWALPPLRSFYGWNSGASVYFSAGNPQSASVAIKSSSDTFSE
jgi:hypothetical protein